MAKKETVQRDCPEVSSALNGSTALLLIQKRRRNRPNLETSCTSLSKNVGKRVDRDEVWASKLAHYGVDIRNGFRGRVFLATSGALEG